MANANAEQSEWMATHKGRHIRTVGCVWQCDDVCGCEQAQVVDYFENKADGRFRIPVGVWEGTFIVGENRDPDDPRPDAELAEYRRALRRDDPQRESAIEWQEGVDYDA